MEAVLMVCDLVPKKLGGFERFLIGFGRRCRETGILLGLTLAGEPIAEVAELLRREGVRWWVAAGWKAPSGKENHWIFLREFTRISLIESWDVAAFHFCSEVGVASALAFSRLSGRRSAAVWHQHSQIAAATRLKRHVSKIKLLSPFLDAFVAISTIGAQSLIDRGCKPRKVKVILFGVDLPTNRSRGPLRAELKLAGDSSFLMVTVATLIKRKGLDVLLEAVAPLLAGGNDRHLVIVGDGPMKQELEQQAKTLSIHDRVHFLGLRNNVSDIMADCDIFVLSSRSEATPAAIMEAMAVGLPVVATHVGGIPDIVATGETGLLVAPDDAIALREAITAIIQDRELASTFGENGRERCSRLFSIEQLVENHLTLYGALSGKRRLFASNSV